jgi:hypothetical protein
MAAVFAIFFHETSGVKRPISHRCLSVSVLSAKRSETTRSLPPPRAQRKCGGKPAQEASARYAGGDLTTDAEGDEDSARFRSDFSVPPGLTESYS